MEPETRLARHAPTFSPAEDELFQKVKWLILGRLMFAAFLLGSTLVFHFREGVGRISGSLALLYGLIVALFVLSAIYAAMLRRTRRVVSLAYVQVSLDTVAVSLIIYVTGSFASFFSFLYLVVTIYSSMLLYRRGSMFVATLASLQYGVMLVLEYGGFLVPFALHGGLVQPSDAFHQVLYKVLVTTTACFAVAFLSGFLSEQARKTKHELVIMEERVRRVERMAYMGEMAAGLAHEIKNPLASLAGSIQLLREEMAHDSDQDRLMQIVLRETDRLSALVTNFLLFAKPPAGKVETVDLAQAVAETVALFEKDRTCAGRIRVTTALTPDMWVEMDPVHLRQVLWNLLLNAAEAIEGPGSIHVRVAVQKSNTAGITIADDGPGIPADLLATVFDPFFTTKPNGTGLGLSIVHRILESYDGWLDVDCPDTGGTRLVINLKRASSPTSP